MANLAVFSEFVKAHILELLVCVLLLYLLPKLLSLLYQQWQLYWAFKPIPCDPDQHFILGHAPKWVADMGTALDYNCKMAMRNNWKCHKFRFGPNVYQLCGNHPDVIKVLLRDDPKTAMVYDVLRPWLGRGLLTANGARWVRSRRLLTPAFHYDVLRPYLKVYGEAASELVELWNKIPERESFNAFPYISHLTLDVMLRCACSHKSNCQQSESPYISAVYALSDLTTKRVLTFYQAIDLIYYFCPDYWEYRKHIKFVHDFAMGIITRRRKELEKSKRAGETKPSKKYIDFIDILLEAKDESGVGLTDLEIRAEVDTFMFEGHDTTASGLSWTLYNLALHPQHQEICRKEVDDIFDQKDCIETEDLKSLEYLKYCLKESLRLFPPVCSAGRDLAQPTEIGGFQMPKGASVAANIWNIHHHPDFWENPYVFDPLRFTPERSKGRHSHAFIPFSAGSRNCIGQEFALNEEKVLLAYILHNFEISLDESKLPVAKEFLLILRPKGGLHLKLKKRHH